MVLDPNQQQLMKENAELQKQVAELEQKLQTFLAAAQPSVAAQPSAAAHVRLSFLLDNAPLGIVEWDRSMKVVAFSRGAETLFGWKAAEVIGKHWLEWQHVYDEDRPTIEESLNNIGQTKPSHLSSLNRNYRKDGSVFWCEWSDSIVYDADGNVEGILSFVKDVTEQMEAGQALRASEERFRSFIDSSPMNAYIKDQDLRYTFANKMLLDIYGMSLEEYRNTRFSDYFDPETVKMVEDADRKILSGEESRIESEYLGSRGKNQVWLRDIKFPVQLSDGRIGVGGISLDITERKNEQLKLQQSEAHLREAENWFRTTLYSIGDAVITTDLDSRVQQMNSVAEKLTGWTEDSARGKKLAEIFVIVNEHTRSEVENPVHRVLREGKVVGLANHTILLSRDSNERPVVDSAAPILNEAGDIIGTVLVFRDQSAEREAQRAIQRSEERYRLLFNSPADAILLHNWEGRFLDVNQTACQRLGYNREELLQMYLQDIVIPESTAKMEARLQQISQTGELVFESAHIHRSGQVTPVETNVKLVELNGEKLLLSISRDITLRKRAERALHENEKLLRNIIDTSLDYIFVKDRDLRMVICNEVFSRAMGKNAGELVGKTDIENGWDPAFVKGNPDKGIRGFEQDDFAALAGETIFIPEEPGNVGGRIRYFETYKLPLRNDSGEITGMMGISRDITERKDAAEALRISEDKFYKIFQATPSAITVTKIDTGEFIDVNQAFETIFGYTRQEILGRTSFEINFWKDPQVRNRHMAEFLSTGYFEKPGIEYVAKSGRTIVADVSFSKIEISGETCAISIISDVTERVKADLALRASEEKFAKTFQRAPLLMTLSVLEDGTYLDVNDEFTKVSGFSREEAVGKTSIELGWIRPAHRNRLHEKLQKDGRLSGMEIDLWTKEGRPVVCLYHGELIEIEGKQRLLSIAQDITEIKSKEKALQESEIRYRSLFESMLSGFALHEIICNENGTPVDYRFLEVNPGFESMTGLKTADLVGKRVLEVLPKTEAYWIERYGQVALTGVPAHFENYAQELDRYYEVVAYCPKEKQFAVLVTDVSERIRTRRALEESESRYRALVETAPVSIIVFQDGKYVFANQTAARLHSLKNIDDLIGKSAMHNIPEDYHMTLQDRMKNLESKTPNEPVEIEIKGVDGIQRLVESTSIPIHFQGKPAALVIGQDITERRRLETSMLAGEKLASIGSLAAGIAHEINTPLQIITGLSQRMVNQIKAGEPDLARMLKDLNNLDQNSWRVARIVRSLLSYSRISMDEVTQNNLNEIVRDTLVLTEHQFASWANVRIRTDLQEDLPNFKCERNSIIQVLINLMTNARDAMPSGGEILVSTGYNPSRRQFVLQVSDTGTGIPEEDLQRIFEPFYTTKRTGEGTGLGLSVVKSVVETHGGSIHVSSRMHTGTTFTITLPDSPPIIEQASNENPSSLS